VLAQKQILSWSHSILRDFFMPVFKVYVEFNSLLFNWAPRHEGVLGSGGIAALIL
jgi:hypothetical protein